MKNRHERSHRGRMGFLELPLFIVFLVSSLSFFLFLTYSSLLVFVFSFVLDHKCASSNSTTNVRVSIA
jgi:hypothetical protein